MQQSKVVSAQLDEFLQIIHMWYNQHSGKKETISVSQKAS